jgi:hypothetical protein
VREGFDIVTNHVAVAPTSDVNAYRVRLEQGVLDTSAEAVVAMSACVITGNADECEQLENTSELLHTSLRQGVDWATVRTDSDLERLAPQLPDIVKAHVREALATGHVAVVPQETVPINDRHVTSWWRANPKTGEVLGIGERGAGQTTVTKMLMTGALVVSTVKLCQLGMVVRADHDCRSHYHDSSTGGMRGGYRDLADCIGKEYTDKWKKQGKTCMAASVFGAPMLVASGISVFILLWYAAGFVVFGGTGMDISL